MKMSQLPLSSLILLLLLTHFVRLDAAEHWLRVGEIRRLPAPAKATVRIGTRGVIRAVDGGETVQIIALKPGTTTVAIGAQVHQVHVNLNNQRDFAIRLKTMIQSMMGLRLETDTHSLTVRGTLLRMEDWMRIRQLALSTQGEYRFAAQALPDVAEQAMAQLNQEAQTRGVPIVRFRSDPTFTAQIPRAAASLRDEANAVFKPYGIQVESSGSGLALQPLVRTRVILAEISREQSSDFGIQWPSAYQAQVLPKLSPSAEGLMVQLRALESKGRAQILASPNLLCRSGGEARFHAGGEFPIRMISRTTRDVIWKSHGVILRVKPKADFQGAISLEIESEVSLLDMANSVDGIPALKSNTVKSHFDLPGRRTIALSGLLRQEVGSAREGLPYLSRIPVLGPLFSSRQFIQRQSELVIFVTPEIYVPDRDEKVEMPAGWVRHEI